MKLRRLLYLILFYSCFLFISYPLNLVAQSQGNLSVILQNIPNLLANMQTSSKSSSSTITNTSGNPLYSPKYSINKINVYPGNPFGDPYTGWGANLGLQSTPYTLTVIDNAPITNYALSYTIHPQMLSTTTNSKPTIPIYKIDVTAKSIQGTVLFNASIIYRCNSRNCSVVHFAHAFINYGKGKDTVISLQQFSLDRNKRNDSSKQLIVGSTTYNTAYTNLKTKQFIKKTDYDNWLTNVATPITTSQSFSLTGQYQIPTFLEPDPNSWEWLNNPNKPIANFIKPDDRSVLENAILLTQLAPPPLFLTNNGASLDTTKSITPQNIPRKDTTQSDLPTFQ